jgi:uncharacterized membrane protein (DUF2068 family)
MPARRLNVLGWIVAFKAFKSLSLTAVGIVLLTVRHRDPVDLLMTAALAIHLPLTSRIFARLLAIAVNLTIRQETALALTAFGYAVLMASEGIGLHLRKPWARWFTIGATSSLVPIEVYEILREPHAVRLLVFAANVAIIVYLVKRREAFD